jgi:hypothetical protein
LAFLEAGVTLDDIVETDRIQFPCPSYSYDAVVLVLRPPAISDVDSTMACLHEALAKAGPYAKQRKHEQHRH